MSKTEDIIRDCEQKEKEFLRLLHVKAEKMTNAYLTKHEHTQLAYLTKDNQEFKVAIPKGILLDKMIAYLNSV